MVEDDQGLNEYERAQIAAIAEMEAREKLQSVPVKESPMRAATSQVAHFNDYQDNRDPSMSPSIEGLIGYTDI